MVKSGQHVICSLVEGGAREAQADMEETEWKLTTDYP